MVVRVTRRAFLKHAVMVAGGVMVVGMVPPSKAAPKKPKDIFVDSRSHRFFISSRTWVGVGRIEEGDYERVFMRPMRVGFSGD